jgi:hypothetical protein
MAISRKDIFKFSFFYYGEYFTGSYRGLRYRLGRDPLENVFFAPEETRRSGRLSASVWPEPFSYDSTPAESIETRDFDFSEEGLLEAIKWINEKYEGT